MNLTDRLNINGIVGEGNRVILTSQGDSIIPVTYDRFCKPEIITGGSKFARFHVANHFLIQILHNMRYTQVLVVC